MTTRSLAQSEMDVDLLAEAELCVREPEPDLDRARQNVRRWLLNECDPPLSSGSLAEAIHTLSLSPRVQTKHAAVTLRYLAIPDLLKSTKTDQFDRAVIKIVELTCPTLIGFLGIQPKQQTFEKISFLSAAHHQVEKILAPLTRNYGDIDSLLSSRKDILGALNHTVIREYCDVFRLNDVRSTVELVIARAKKVSALEPTMLLDYEEFARVLSTARDSIPEIGSFLAYNFLRPFLDETDKVLGSHLTSVRGRLKAKIHRSPSANITLAKRYPLREVERSIQISVPLENIGPGLATDVRVTGHSLLETIYVSDFSIELGNISPGLFSVIVDALVMAPTDSFRGMLEISWGEIGSQKRSDDVVEFEVIAQSGEIDWKSFAHWAPYSTDVAEGADFIGREERVGFLSGKILRSTMEPFYITGQKRVGKTSLVKAASASARALSQAYNFEIEYILWGAVAHESPNASINALGQRIETMLREALDYPLSIPISDFHDSLSGLVTIAERALKNKPQKRFLIIIDEFDEIHSQLYLQGDLANTFFANLRALSRVRNICLALVGGENMPFVMDRQGQKLNNFSQVNLTSYSRLNEWDDFRMLIEEPVRGLLTWHEEALSEVYNASNGNPYFAKVVCAQVARSAISERDVDISGDEVRRAIEREVSLLGANFFVHLWRDGISKPSAEQEPDILRRMRLLVAFARCLRNGLPTTAANIAESRASAALGETEVVVVLKDFIRRGIMREQHGHYDIVLPIFAKWLVDVGAGHLMADALSEELAATIVSEENAAVVRSEEVVALTKSWPPYQGRHIGVDEVRGWLQQVAGPKDQRLLFSLLQRLRFFSEVEVRERLRTAHSMIRPSLPDFVIRHRNERRSDIAITFVDGAGKSGASHASLYAEANGIAAVNVISPDNFRRSFEEIAERSGIPAAVIIVDDIAATGGTLAEKLTTFLESYGDLFQSTKIRVVTIVSSVAAQATIDNKLTRFPDLDVEFRTCETLPLLAYAFPEGANAWESSESAARAEALCTNLGSRIHKQRPLGFGGLGMLVVFPTTVPNTSLPILHSFARAGSGQPWTPLFVRPNN